MEFGGVLFYINLFADQCEFGEEKKHLCSQTPKEAGKINCLF